MQLDAMIFLNDWCERLLPKEGDVAWKPSTTLLIEGGISVIVRNWENKIVAALGKPTERVATKRAWNGELLSAACLCVEKRIALVLLFIFVAEVECAF